LFEKAVRRSLKIVVFLVAVLLAVASLLFWVRRPTVADRIYFERHAGGIYTKAVFVDSWSFTDKRIRAMCEQVLKEKSQFYRVIDLAIADNELDIVPIVGYADRTVYMNPAYYNDDEWLGRSKVARMLYRDGSAIVRIKDGRQITRKQLRGNHDPADIDLPDFHGTMQLCSVPKRYPAAANSSGDYVRFFVEAKSLPSLNQAKSCFDALRQLAPAILVIRVNSMFFEDGGPLADMFSVPYPNRPEDEYYKERSIWCSDIGFPSSPVSGTCESGYPQRFPKGWAR
jgi:hypothetical protein